MDTRREIKCCGSLLIRCLLLQETTTPQQELVAKSSRCCSRVWRMKRQVLPLNGCGLRLLRNLWKTSAPSRLVSALLLARPTRTANGLFILRAIERCTRRRTVAETALQLRRHYKESCQGFHNAPASIRYNASIHGSTTRNTRRTRPLGHLWRPLYTGDTCRST